MMDKKQDPYKVQLADIANEIGGNMAIKYYTLDFTLTKEQLQDMKKNGLKTDVMSCIFAALIMNDMNETEVKEYTPISCILSYFIFFTINVPVRQHPADTPSTPSLARLQGRDKNRCLVGSSSDTTTPYVHNDAPVLF